MGIINHLFASPEESAKESLKDEELIAKAWKEYASTVPEKEQIINGLPSLFGERKAHLQRLSGLLRLELVDIRAGEEEEDDLIINIQSLEHSKKIERIKKLEDCLCYVETKYEYIHQLLFHLYAILKSEARLLEKLNKNSDLRKYRKWVDELKSELVVEKTLIGKMEERKSFHDLLVGLVKREHIIKIMDKEERRLLKEMKREMDKIWSGRTGEGMIFELTKEVFNSIEDEVREVRNADGGYIISGYYDDMNLEYVNRPEFVEMVRRKIDMLGITDQISEQMITVFVHLFREWYNHVRKKNYH